MTELLGSIYKGSGPGEREKLTPVFRDLAKEYGYDLPEDIKIGKETAEERRARAAEERAKSAEGRAEIDSQIKVGKEVREQEVHKKKIELADIALEKGTVDWDTLTTWEENAAEYDSLIDADYYSGDIKEDERAVRKAQNPWRPYVRRGQELLLGASGEKAEEIPSSLPKGTTFIGKTPQGKSKYELPDGRIIVAK